jgi:hypothetical protein
VRDGSSFSFSVRGAVRLDALALVAGLWAVLLAGCIGWPFLGTCTLMGCQDELRIEVQGELSPGSWRFEVRSEEQLGACELQLPADQTSTSPCEGRLELWVGSTNSLSLVVPLPSAEVVASDELPQSFELTVLRDSEVVLHRELAPGYQTVQPNGQGCAPICHQASATIDL